MTMPVAKDLQAPALARGKEQHYVLNAFGSVSDTLMYIAGNALYKARTQCKAIHEDWKRGTFLRIVSVPLRCVAVAASALFGAVTFVSSLAVRTPITLGEKVGRVALFRMRERSGPDQLTQAKETPDFTMVSLNIMGLPSFICDMDHMKRCDDRLPHIIQVLKEQNADVIFLQECFLDVYAKKIFDALPSQYRYMVSQVEGGNFTALYGSGLVIISKHPIEQVQVRQYTDLLQREKLSQKGVVSAIVNYQGQKMCLGATHLQAAGPLKARSVRNEMATAIESVDDLASKVKGCVVKTIVGDMNVSTTEGIYSKVNNEKDATHYLLTKNGQGGEPEEKIIRKGESIPDEDSWKKTLLREESLVGTVSEKKPKVTLSRVYGRSGVYGPTGEKGWSVLSTEEGSYISAVRETVGLGHAHVIKENTKPLRNEKISAQRGDQKLTVPVYKKEDTEKHLVQGRNIDQCLFSPADPAKIQATLSVVGFGAGGSAKTWKDSVSDHRAIKATLMGVRKKTQ